MAKQKGLINFEGRIGNFAFYKTRDGYAARDAKGSITGERVRLDPKFQRTRENGQEFGRAGRAGKLLRDALRNILVNISDSMVVARLTTALLRVVKSDTVNERGLRTVTAGDPTLLVGFEFNQKAALGMILSFPVVAEIDRDAAQGRVALPAFIPANMIKAVEGASHYQFKMGVVSADFEGEVCEQTLQTLPPQQLLSAEVAATTLTVDLPANSQNKHVFLVFGVQFLQIVNGREYPLKNKSNNVMTVVEASPMAA